MRSKMSRGLSLITLPLLLVAVLAGCSSTSNDEGGQGEQRTVESVDGPVQIPQNPQRIVALRGIGEALVSLGAKNVVGVPSGYTEDYFGDDKQAWARYQELPKVGPINAPDIEKIVALSPDLILGNVLTKHWEMVDKDKLKAIAPTVNLPGGDEVVTDWYRTFAQAADIAGLKDEADKQKKEFEERGNEIHEKYRSKIDGKTFAGVASWAQGAFYLQTSGSYIAHKAEVAGLTFPKEQGQEYSIEKIEMLSKYDGIVYGREADGSVSPLNQALLDSELFKNLPAVKAGRVIALSNPLPFTYRSAMVTLRSLDEQLAKYPQ